MENLIPGLTLLVVSGLGTVLWHFVKRLISKVDSLGEGQSKLDKSNSNLQLSVLGLKENISDIPKLVSSIGILGKRIDSIALRINSFENDLKIALLAANQVERLQKQVAVLERNQKTQWEKIDLARAEVEAMRAEQDAFAGMIADFRAHVEKLLSNKGVKNGR